MRIEVDYRPTPKQAAFHQSRANEALFGGAAGGGKSKALVMDALARVLMHPGTHAYLFRRTYRELEDTLVAEARASIPRRIGLYNASRHEMQVVGGGVLHFRHCRGKADMYDYAGTEMHWLYFDELTSFEQPVYEYLKTRLRAKASLGIVPVVRCASNPGGIGHAWVRARFVDAGTPMKPVRQRIFSRALGREREVSTQYIPALATENPHVGQAYIFELESKPEALRRALLEGDWNAFEGQVFTEFRDDPTRYGERRWTHVIKPFAIPGHWMRYVSFDHGYSKPFSVGWWAVSPSGTAFRYREWYGWNGTPNRGMELSPKEIARGILAREEEERREGIRFDRIADPSIFERSRGESIAQQMGAEGVQFRKGDNARLAGKMQLHGRLRFDPEGRPGLYVFDCCRQFIRTVPALAYDAARVEDVDTDAEDHVYDETRYFLMSKPYGQQGGME